MGVPNLSTFVTKIDGLRKEHQLRNTRLVFDGNNYMYYLYCKFSQANPGDFLFAGNYRKLCQYISTFFGNLAKCAITPILVFDGSLNPNLVNSRSQRFEKAFQKSQILSDHPPPAIDFAEQDIIFPFLLRNCFISMAKEHNVTCLQTRQDSDLDTARLANELQCPVISNDSDFLVMKIDEGVISAQSFDWQNIQTSKNKSHIECKIYKVEDFVDHFNLKPEMLPIFASLMGNDGIDGQVFDGLIAEITNGRRIENADNDLFHYEYVQERLERMNLLLHWLSHKFFSAFHAQEYIIKYLKNNGVNGDQFITSVQSYESKKGTFLKTLLDYQMNETNEDEIPVDKLLDEHIVPKWFLLNVYHCEIDALLYGFIDKQLLFMRPLVEDFNLECVFQIIYDLNGYMLGLLRLSSEDRSPIKLVVRANSSREFITVLIQPKTHIMGWGDQELPLLTELHKYSDIQKKNLLFSILNVDHKWIEELGEKLRLLKIDDNDIEFWTYFLMVFKYWKHNTKLYLRDHYFGFVRALVLSIIYYRHKSLIRDDFKGLMSLTKNQFKPNISHYLSEFQVVYSTIDKLVAFLGHPIKSVALHRYLNGILYYNLFGEISANRLPFYAFKDRKLNTLNIFIMASL